MSNNEAPRRNKLYDYIRVADNKKINALFLLLEDEIEQTEKWWESRQFVEELDDCHEKMEKGLDPGVSISKLEKNIDLLRIKKYGRKGKIVS